MGLWALPAARQNHGQVPGVAILLLCNLPRCHSALGGTSGRRPARWFALSPVGRCETTQPDPAQRAADSVQESRDSGHSRPVLIQRMAQGVLAPSQDLLAVEEPLEVRIEGVSYLVTMRTPGHDLDLVAGLLHSEGLIDGPDDIRAMAHVDSPFRPRGNTVDVRLAAGVAPPAVAKARRVYASSACGVCGAASMDEVLRSVPRQARAQAPDPAVLHPLPAQLREVQATFELTGGLHGAALFTMQGELQLHREDIGRHNAVDKVVGARLWADELPVDDCILLTSGRVGFEIIQKAAMARIPVVCAVGAPSSLAAALAWEAGIVLIGFLRDDRYNIYEAVGDPASVVEGRG